MSGLAGLPPGPSPVARGRSYLPGTVRAAGAIACALAAAGGLTWVLMPRAPRDDAPSVQSRVAWSIGQEMPDPPRAAPAPEPAAMRPIPPPPVPAPAAAPPPAAVALAPPLHLMGVWDDTAAIQEGAQRAVARQQAQAQGQAAPRGAGDPDVATPGGSEYAQRMQTTHFADTAPVPHNLHVHYTIKKGQSFGCTPAGAISTSLPGPVECTVDENVWSMDGTTILLPRGTQVNGTIERGLTTGEDRAFLVWTDALTPAPDLKAIPLDAPAADELGLPGVPGDVNDHLWRKIKAALLVSLIETGSNVATGLAQRGNGNTNLNFGGIGGQSTSLASQALGHDLNIPPTLYRGPGQPLIVKVNKYIDLYKFYENRPRKY